MERYALLVLAIITFMVRGSVGSQDYIPTATEVQLLEVLEECEAVLSRDKSCKLIAVVDGE